jgi:hypothetical protein
MSGRTGRGIGARGDGQGDQPIWGNFDSTVKKSVPANTYDRGKEMALHKRVASDLNLTVYFADPHAPWQLDSAQYLTAMLVAEDNKWRRNQRAKPWVRRIC